MGGGGTKTTYQTSQTPDVYQPVAPERTIADTPDMLDRALFTEGASLSSSERAKKTSATSRLVIPLDTTNSNLTGGTTPPPTPTAVV